MFIKLKKCSSCNKFLHVDKSICPNCYTDELGTTEVNGEGKIYSFTKIYAAPTKHADAAPYYIVLVEIENGFKVTGRLLSEHVTIGDSVSLKDTINGAYYFEVN